MTPTSEQTVKNAAESTPVKLLGRVGLATYGVVHLLVAYLAIQVAVGAGGKADKTGALQAIASTDAGLWPLWVVAIGLGALVVWQLSELLLGNRGVSGPRLLGKRATNVGEALLFGYLAYSAGRIASGSKGPSDSDQSSLVAKLLAEPYGKVLVIAVGLAILGAAAMVAHRGLTKRFVEDLDLRPASPSMRRTILRLGQVGYAALGVAYGIAGLLVIVAAVRSDPSKATGLDTSLKTLAAQPYGQLLLIVVAAGVAAFGAFALLDARYRRT